MGYTSEAVMDDRSLRDVERWKEKIEVRLDNRQVFFLFFGSALVACLLFVLGVIVGKRMESRVRTTAPEIDDPLALLDRVASAPAASEQLSFPKALLGASKGAPAELRPSGAAHPTRETKTTVTRVEAPRPVVAAVPPAKPVAKERPTIAAVAPNKPKTTGATPIAKIPAKPAGHFTLQISSFQDRAEADAFAAQFPSASPYIVASSIPGKGLWYRVRSGDFASPAEAEAAKAAFEKQHNKIAYIAPK